MNDSYDNFMRGLYATKERTTLGVPPPEALVLGHELLTNDPLYYEPSDFYKSAWIVGPPGKGKTTLLETMVYRLLVTQEHHGVGASVIDTHGGLAAFTRDVLTTFPWMADRVVLMDLEQAQWVVGLGPLRRATTDNLQAIAQSLTSSVIKACGATSPHAFQLIQTVMTYLLEALAVTDKQLTDASFFLLRDEQSRRVFERFIDRIPDHGPTRDLHAYWTDFKNKSKSSIEVSTMGPLNRLRPLIRPRELRRILGSTVTLDVLAAMDEKPSILVYDFSIPQRESNVTVEGANLLASFVVQEYAQVFRKRERDRARGHILIMDEAPDYLTLPAAKAFLSQARKFHLGCVISHQATSQLVTEDSRELLDLAMQIPNKMIFGGIPPEDAKLLAENLFLTTIDTDEIKFEEEQVAWDPRLRKVIVTSHATGESRAVTEAETTSRGTSHGTTQGTNQTLGGSSAQGSTSSRGGSYDLGELVATHRNFNHGNRQMEGTSSSSGSSRSDSQCETEAEAHTSAVTRATNTQVTESEQWINDPVRRLYKTGRQYRHIEESIFRLAQRLHAQPTGRVTATRLNRAPRSCQVTHLHELDLTAEQRQPFMDLVRQGPNGLLHQDTAAVDRALAEREQKLLAATGPEVETIDMSAPARKAVSARFTGRWKPKVRGPK